MANLTAITRQLGRRRRRARQALNEVGDLLALARVTPLASALEFARSRRVSPLAYPAAHGAHLDMVPPWVDPRAGLVVDVGANEGDWIAAVLRLYPEAEVLAAEPGAEPRARLEARFAGSANVRIDPRAVSDQPGEATFFRTRASVFASLLPPRPDLHDLYALPGAPTEVLEQQTVATVALDELVGDRAVSVLKLDVQGGELAVIRSGAHTLAKTSAILVEILYQPHYEGDATFRELDRELTRLGFTLMNLSPPFRLGDGPALWSDACYARPESSPQI